MIIRQNPVYDCWSVYKRIATTVIALKQKFPLEPLVVISYFNILKPIVRKQASNISVIIAAHITCVDFQHLRSSRQYQSTFYHK